MSTTRDYLKLSLPERIQLVQDIWDSIAAESQNAEVPPWQQAELDRRLDEAAQSPNDLLTWDEVLQDIEADRRA